MTAYSAELPVAIFPGFFKPKGDWHCVCPPRSFSALLLQTAFRRLAGVAFAHTRVRRRATA